MYFRDTQKYIFNSSGFPRFERKPFYFPKFAFSNCTLKSATYKEFSEIVEYTLEV